MPRPGFCASLLLAVACAAQARDVRLVAIVAGMADNLARSPNYTCTETVERFKSGEPCRECEYTDRLRLEVAFLDGREQFAWPGESGFRAGSIFELIGSGAIVTGDFAGFARRVFLTDRPAFIFAGQTVLNGRPAHRYDFRVGPDRTTFGARAEAERGYSTYSGSLWADAETLDLLRLDIEASAFPARLDLERVKSTVSYSRIPIGKSDFVLPRNTDAEILSRNGVRSRNRTEYTACREYSAESRIRFGEETAPVPENAAPRPGRQSVAQLPPGFRLTTYLPSPLRLSELAIGDPVAFVLAREVRAPVRVPRGALLRGRIVALAQHTRPRAFTMLGIQPTALEFKGTRIEFRGGIVSVRAPRRPHSPAYRVETWENQSTLYFEAGVREIRKRSQFYWMTIADEKQ